MANAADMLGTLPVRMLIVGYPGAGKTSALAALANAGFKLRIIAFDKMANMAPLFAYTNPDKLGNIDIVAFEDKMRSTPNGMEPVGLPKAFADALSLMERWKYKNPDGTETDLGKPSEWGLDTIVVLDTLTTMGEAAKRAAMVMNNKTPKNMTQAVWGMGQNMQLEFIKRINANSNGFHSIVNAHLVMIGPKDIAESDNPVTKELKEKAAGLIPTKLFPSALGKALPPLIGGEFATIIKAMPKYKGGKDVGRVLTKVSGEELDLKLPVSALANFPNEVDISDGLLQMFRALSPQSVAALEAQGTGPLVPTS
jgi:hypothetical protein